MKKHFLIFNRPKLFKKIKLATFFLLTILFTLLLFGEIFSRVYFALNPDQEQKVQDSLNQKNEFARLVNSEDCGFNKVRGLHPNFGFIYKNLRKDHKCYKKLEPNNFGFLRTRNYPEYKSHESFDILLTGGSVASGLAAYGGYFRFGNTYLERALNKYVIPPKGKKFRIYNGAQGGWRLPSQLIAISLYGKHFSGVISLDGYNELVNLNYGSEIDTIDLIGYTSIVKSYQEKSFLSYFLMNCFRLGQSYSAIKFSNLFLLLYSKGLSIYIDQSINEELGYTFFPQGTKSEVDYIRENIEKFGHYMDTMNASAKSQGLYFAHFLQPVRQVGKILTEKEKAFKSHIKREHYILLEKEFLQRKEDGMNVDSLSNLLSDIEEQTYIDSIHFTMMQDQKNIFNGNELLAKTIALKVAKMWNLKLKNVKSEN